MYVHLTKFSKEEIEKRKLPTLTTPGKARNDVAHERLFFDNPTVTEPGYMKIAARLILLIFIISSCERPSRKDILLPDGFNIAGLSIKTIEQRYSLLYSQYEGFKGTTEDSVLRNFIIITDASTDYVLSDSEIEQLKDEPVTGVMFEKISQSSFSFDSLIGYVMRVYMADSVNMRNDSAILMKNGNQVCSIGFYDFGKPGYVVRAP